MVDTVATGNECCEFCVSARQWVVEVEGIPIITGIAVMISE